jgi:hypothetical protein
MQVRLSTPLLHVSGLAVSRQHGGVKSGRFSDSLEHGSDVGSSSSKFFARPRSLARASLADIHVLGRVVSFGNTSGSVHPAVATRVRSALIVQVVTSSSFRCADHSFERLWKALTCVFSDLALGRVPGHVVSFVTRDVLKIQGPRQTLNVADHRMCVGR